MGANEIQEQFPAADIDTLLADVDIIKQSCCVSAHHEKVYPYDTAGVSVTPGNQVWGNTFVIVPIDGIVDDYGWGGGVITNYAFVGVNIMLSAGASKPNTYNLLRVVKTTEQALTGDANAAQKVVPIGTTGDFLVGDIVWLVDNDTANGEIGEIDTMITDTSITLVNNLGNNYTTAQSAKVYLVRRKGSNAFRSVWGKFAHADTKSCIKHNLHHCREMEVGDGIIVRAFGIDDATGVMLMTVVYDDDVVT